MVIKIFYRRKIGLEFEYPVTVGNIYREEKILLRASSGKKLRFFRQFLRWKKAKFYGKDPAPVKVRTFIPTVAVFHGLRNSTQSILEQQWTENKTETTRRMNLSKTRAPQVKQSSEKSPPLVFDAAEKPRSTEQLFDMGVTFNPEKQENPEGARASEIMEKLLQVPGCGGNTVSDGVTYRAGLTGSKSLSTEDTCIEATITVTMRVVALPKLLLVTVTMGLVAEVETVT
ncbi:hypothetical protein B0H17DRAFT_1135424 [Mycena rosella]|uniref:Uncharacterized protein n=1 Tax=Mycena rosella TaxID=1033263 RepID=A0AAD7GI00_MYCRO|nr:hypothetical protein B0H17DRAFT_1135424 [Mycena rosella]